MAKAPFRMKSLDELPPEVENLFNLHQIDVRVRAMAIHDYRQLCDAHDRRTRDVRVVSWALASLERGQLYLPDRFSGEVHSLVWDGMCERELWNELCEWAVHATPELQRRGAEATKADLQLHLAAHSGSFANGKLRPLSQEERRQVDAGTHQIVRLGSKFAVPAEEYHIPLADWPDLEVKEKAVVALYWLIQVLEQGALNDLPSHLNCVLAEQMVAAFEEWAMKFNQRRNAIEALPEISRATRALLHLADRDEKNPWSLEAVPEGCDLEVLRVLDTRRHIEFRYITCHECRDGALIRSGWFSPSASPVIAGSIAQMMASATRQGNIYCEIRVTELGRAFISENELEPQTSKKARVGQRNPGNGVSREEARQRAEHYVRQCNDQYPGFNKLAAAIGVSKGGLQNAIEDSPYLKGIIEAHERAQALKGGSVRATVPARDSDVDTRVPQTMTDAECDRLLGGLADDASEALRNHTNRHQIAELLMNDSDRQFRGNTGGPKAGRPKPVAGGRSDFSAENGKSR